MSVSSIRAAACHASPVFLSAKATTDKCLDLIHQAASNQANLVVFPESFIPAFPFWGSLRAPTQNHALFKRMVCESVYADGEEVRAIIQAAKQTNTFVSVGVSEKVHYSSATLFNSNLFIGPEGVLVHHRKLMPTFFEKLTWSPGDGHGLRVADTPFGKIGNLICGENTNPLARYALMAQGEQVHISTWPAIWPTRHLKSSKASAEPGADHASEIGVKSGVNYDNVAANRTRAAAHCFEAKCFGVLCSGFLGPEAIDTVSSGLESETESKSIREALKLSPRGATMYLDPTGALLPAFTVKNGHRKSQEFLQNEEDVLYTDIQLDDCLEGKQYHDVVGGYQRFDVFDLKINRSRHKPVSFIEGVKP